MLSITLVGQTDAGGTIVARSRPATTVRRIADDVSSVAVFPSIGKAYTLTVSNGSAPARIEIVDILRARPVRVISICRAPQNLVAATRFGLLFASCARAEDGPSTIFTLDVRSERVIRRLDLADAGTFDARAVDDGYLFLGDGRVFDVRTGRVRGTPGSGGTSVIGYARGIFVTRNRAADEIDLVRARSGSVAARMHVGRNRDPSDAVIAPDVHRLLVTFQGAGMLGSFDTTSGRLIATFGVGKEPAAVRYDSAGQRVAIASFDPRTRDAQLVTMRADGTDRDAVSLEAEPARPNRNFRLFRDRTTQGFIVVDDTGISVVGVNGKRAMTLPLPGSNAVHEAVLDERSDTAYVWYGDDAGSNFLASVPLHGDRPSSIAFVGAQPTAHEPDTGDSRDPDAVTSFPAPSLPYGAEASGSRSPFHLAAAPDGSIVVAEYGSPTIGRFDGRRYSERSVATRGTPAYLAVDRTGTIWFSEYTRDGPAYVGCVTAAGAVSEIAIPPGPYSAPDEDRAAHPGSVVVNGGDVWLLVDDARTIVRIRGTEVAQFRLPDDARARRTFDGARMSARLAGGVYVVNDGLWAVDDDGAISRVTGPFRFEPRTNVAPAPDGSVVAADDEQVVAFDRDGGAIGMPLGPMTRQMTVTARSRTMTVTCNPTSLFMDTDRSTWLICGDAVLDVQTNGSVRRFALPDSQADATSFVRGPDGAVWFAEPNHSRLGRITTDGTITEFPI